MFGGKTRLRAILELRRKKKAKRNYYVNNNRKSHETISIIEKKIR